MTLLFVFQNGPGLNFLVASPTNESIRRTNIKRTKTVRDQRSLSLLIEAVNDGIWPMESGHPIIQPLKAVAGGLAIDK